MPDPTPKPASVEEASAVRYVMLSADYQRYPQGQEYVPAEGVDVERLLSLKVIAVMGAPESE